MRIALLVLLLAGLSPAQETPDAARGKLLFRANCAGCHGIDGAGGSGPSLTRARFKRAPDTAALIELITEGIPKAGMPSSWHLLPDGPKQLAAYITTLRQVNEPPVPGDVQHGRSVYRSAGCGGCHIVLGEGKGIGPELSDIGARRTAAFLRRAIANPAAAESGSFLMVRVQPRGGAEVRGIRLNEDSFTIQLKDAAGAFHSYRKADLAVLEKQSGQTLMPGYSNLPTVDVQDLAAYLVSLRGEQ